MLAQFICFASVIAYVGLSPFQALPDGIMVILCEVQIFVCLSLGLAIGDGEDTSSLIVAVLHLVTLAPLGLFLPLSMAQLFAETGMQASWGNLSRSSVFLQFLRISSRTRVEAHDNPTAHGS